MRALEPSRVSGRVIVIPALDYAAVMGGTRVSPIDGVNMNRALVDALAVPVRGGGPAVDGEPEGVDPYAGGMTAGKRSRMTRFSCYAFFVSCNSENFPMKNITVTLPEDLARWVRIRAAENERSVSRWLAELLEGMRRQDDGYAIAMKQFLAVEPRRMEWIDGRKPTREELHDRAGLR